MARNIGDRSRKQPVIRISDITYLDLITLSGEIQQATAKRCNIGETVAKLIKFQRESKEQFMEMVKRKTSEEHAKAEEQHKFLKANGLPSARDMRVVDS